MKSIEHVTKEEIARAYAPFCAAPKTTEKPVNEKPANRSYVSRLRMKDLEHFFNQFDPNNIIYKLKDEQGKDLLFADVGKFKTYFSDFDFAVEFHPEVENPSTFDYDALIEYCNATDITIEQLIADMIAFDLMTPLFPSYAESLEKHRNKKADEAYSQLPKAVQKAVKTVNEKHMADNAAVGNRGKFGSFIVESGFGANFNPSDN